MRPFLVSAVLACSVLCLAPPVHAEAIDQLTLTGPSLDLVFTLPAIFTFPDQLHLVELPAVVGSGSLNGVTGYTVTVNFVSPALAHGVDLVLSVASSAPGSATFAGIFYGGQLATLTGQTGTPGNYIDTATISFIGTTPLILDPSSVLPPPTYPLSIEPVTSAAIAPEPASFLLLLTGFGTVLRLRHASVQPHSA